MLSDSDLPPTTTAATTAASSSSILPSLLALAMTIAALAAVTTSALFTETDSVGSNSFSTGSVDLSTNPTTQIVYAANDMAPGDSETGNVTVSNDGSLEYRYSVTSTTTEDTLAAQLDMTIWAEADETTVDQTCDATAPTTTIYAPNDLGSTTGVDVVGDSTQGNQTGDRTLTSLDSELLCFRVELPSSTGNTYESLTTDATFAFNAEQTANNA